MNYCKISKIGKRFRKLRKYQDVALWDQVVFFNVEMKWLRGWSVKPTATTSSTLLVTALLNLCNIS